MRILQPTPEVKEYCKRRLVVANPDYIKKERMGKWTGGIPEWLNLYEKIGDELWLPFGCFQDIWTMHPVRDDWDAEFRPVTALEYHSSIKLYPYQENAVQAALRFKNGIMVMPCGAGKTQSGLELIARIGGRALWLTHTQDLLMQSMKRAESVFSGVGIGTITAGKVDMGTHITFATVQTISKISPSVYENYFDVVIVDEAQHCAGTPTRMTQFYRVLNRINARYKFGLTATPKRADGLEQSMFSIIGRKICEISRDDVAHTTCPIKVQTIETGYTPNEDLILMGDGTLDYSKMVRVMVEDQERFKLVLDTVLGLPRVPVMVLANRVEYLKQLCDAYNTNNIGRLGVCLSGMGQSMKAKAERKGTLVALNDGDVSCVFATYQLAKEGLDVPQLRYVVFATPEQDATTVIQAAGRVGRKAEGKECGTVIDFVDDFGMYRGWYKKRLSHYRKIGVEEFI